MASQLLVASPKKLWSSFRIRRYMEMAKSKSRWGRLIFKLAVYVLLVDMSFVFLYPFIYMITTSLKTPVDLLDMSIRWIPRSMEVKNYAIAYKLLSYPLYLKNSAILSIVPMAGQVISCSFVGYGFARFKFPGREVLFMLAMFTLIIPPQSLIIPLFIQYKALGWMDTYLPIIIPSFLGAGLRGALFIFIFRQFFRGLPYELEDAARIDGCSSFRIYWNIIIPVSQPAILVTSILSLVWHWNDYFEPSVYLNSFEKFTLPMMLPRLYQQLDQLTSGRAGDQFSITIVMAATFLVILPMLILYLILQKQFMKGIERSGIVE